MIDDLAVLSPTLVSLGWDDRCEAWADKISETSDSELTRGRIARVSRGFSLVFTGGDAVLVNSSSERSDASTAPATGDYVLIGPDDEDAQIITAIAPRRTALIRRMPGRVPEPQILAANVDHVLVMHGLDRELNMRRMERQLVVAFDSGATPVIVLTKSDYEDELVEPFEQTIERLGQAANGVEIITTSAKSGDGLDRLAELFSGHRTSVMLGLSGIGKSTLVNVLSDGVVQLTNEVRVTDRRGRHTTVTRDLIPFPGGGMIIDTPGIREIGLWQAHAGLEAAFSDLSGGAHHCRFADCQHNKEPNCGVQEIIAAGQSTPERLEHWMSLQAELAEQDEQLEEFTRRNESRLRARAEDKQNKQRPKKTKRRGRNEF